MKNIPVILLIIISTQMLCAQVPLTDIEGRLSVYLPNDTTSIHIGKNAGESQTLMFPRSNIFIGTNAGRSTVTGSHNSFFGLNAGKTNESGDGNSFFGSSSGSSNKRGRGNSFFGVSSGSSNKDGDSNSFFGSEAGKANTEGDFNSLLGRSAGEKNTTGNNNVAIGYVSAFNNSNGGSNVSIGSQSMYSAGSVSYNVAMGDSSMYFVDPSNHPEITGSFHTAVGASSLLGKINFEIENSVALGFEAGYDGGSNSIFIGYQAGKNISSHDNRLYISNQEGADALIYGEFDNNLVRVNGELETEDGSIFLRNLGTTDTDQGVKWGESQDLPAFGFIYDGEGLMGNNRLHLREYVTADSADILSIKVNGNVGIGTEDPLNDLEIKGNAGEGVAGFTRSDLENSAKSHILFGNNGDWYIRPSLSSGKIIIADNGGNVGIGTSTPESTLEVNGKINIGNDNQTDKTGDIRYNASNQDFEGFDGTAWLSLTGKSKIYTLNIGAGEIMIDTDDQEDFNISLANGYTTFTSSFGTDGHIFCPLQLPVGSKIIEVTYNYIDNNPADEISFELREYNEDSAGKTSFYQYTTSNISLSGFETKSITSDLTLGANNYYAFIFTLRRTTGTDYDSQKIQGVQVKYVLP